MTDPTEPTQAQSTVTTYKDDDLVYVDPDLRIVVGLVEWGPNERPKSKTVPGPEAKESDDDAKPERKRRRKMYPWGTYRSMKRLYKLEGKIRDEKPMITLDDAITKSQAEPFWD